MNLIQFESYDTYLLYQEYLSISDNPFSFQLPDEMILTTRMMYNFLKTSYHVKNKPFGEPH